MNEEKSNSMKTSTRKRKIGHIPALEVTLKSYRNSLLPLIVYYHGWQINKELMLTQGRKLAERGFRVVLPDAANHGERKQPISSIPSLTFFNSIHTNLFEFSFIIDYFQKRRLADNRIGVGGVSMGGMTTCALLTHNPNIQAAACVMGTPKLLAYRERIEIHAGASNRFLPGDYQDLTSWIPKYDLSLQPEKLANRSLFIWHGQRDWIVPYDRVEEFVDENPNLNLNVHFEDADHLVEIKTMEKVADFFEKKMNI